LQRRAGAAIGHARSVPEPRGRGAPSERVPGLTAAGRRRDLHARSGRSKGRQIRIGAPETRGTRGPEPIGRRPFMTATVNAGLSFDWHFLAS